MRYNRMREINRERERKIKRKRNWRKSDEKIQK
jgi:hypothetical protein